MSDFQKIALSVVALAIAAFGGQIVNWLKRVLSQLTSAQHHTTPVVPPTAPVSPAVQVSPAKPVLGTVSFSGAIDSLAVVRTRLVRTECLDEQSTSAIETLTHALVKGSDK